MDSREIAICRKQTKHFINDHPESVTMTRGGGRKSDGAGGYTVTPGAPIDPQTVRLIPQDLRTGVQSRNVDGEEVSPSYVILGEYNADIKKGDVFVKDNRNYEVTWVREDRRYETWAEVVYRG